MPSFTSVIGRFSTTVNTPQLCHKTILNTLQPPFHRLFIVPVVVTCTSYFDRTSLWNLLFQTQTMASLWCLFILFLTMSFTFTHGLYPTNPQKAVFSRLMPHLYFSLICLEPIFLMVYRDLVLFLVRIFVLHFFHTYATLSAHTGNYWFSIC